MSYFKPFTSTKCNKIVSKRLNETKFGETISILTNHDNIYEQLLKIDVQFVILGIEEDIGVFANQGHTGTSKAWSSIIKKLLNTQYNSLNQAEKVLILGSFQFHDYQNELEKLDQKSAKDLNKVRNWVETIDKEVSFLVSQIVQAGKIPIIIGGGHNNAYGNIKGTSLALKSAINVINFDAHHDFRPLEGRHSGNGFSYAFDEGFLKRYCIFGLHENYISNDILKRLNKLKRIQYRTFEDMAIRKKLKLFKEMAASNKFLGKKPLGIEVDIDAIEYAPSSARSPSGFSVNNARQFVNYFGSLNSATYLHICEAAPSLRNESQIGKLISYLVTDFIRAVEGR